MGLGAGWDLGMDKAPGLEFWGGAGAGGTDRGGSSRRWAPSPIRRAWLVGRCPRASGAQGSGCDTLCPTPSPVCYVPGRGKLETFTPRDVPGPLGAELAVLRLCARCIQQGLREVRAGWGWAWLGRWGHPRL